jgi:hypothetical protein
MAWLVELDLYSDLHLKEKKMTKVLSAFACGAILSAGAFAQERVQLQVSPQIGFSYEGGDFTFVRTAGGMETRLVKNSPYSAQSVTEFTQTLADGNRIHRTTTGSIVRDSEGRTRREQTISAIGPMAGSGEAMKSVMIHDPVAGTSYTLEPHSHAAIVNHSGATAHANIVYEKAAAEKANAEKMSPEAMAKMKALRRGADPNTKADDLGTQVMEGVTVQGKRVTRTIPAGEIGNDRPLEIVTETWFSPELQVVVMSRTTDPRSGDSVYKLTGVSRAEPDPALFQVPADYQIKEQGRGEGGNVMIHRTSRPEE